MMDNDINELFDDIILDVADGDNLHDNSFQNTDHITIDVNYEVPFPAEVAEERPDIVYEISKLPELIRSYITEQLLIILSGGKKKDYKQLPLYEETTWWKKVQEAETTRRLNKRGTFHWR